MGRKKNHCPSAHRRRRRLLAIGERQLMGQRTIEDEKLFEVARAHARKVIDAQVKVLDEQPLRPQTMYMTQKDWDDIVMWTDETKAKEPIHVTPPPAPTSCSNGRAPAHEGAVEVPGRILVSSACAPHAGGQEGAE